MSILTAPHAVAARKAGQTVRIIEQGTREGGTTGHQAAEGSGLRGHSCGDTFPFDYVTLGSGTHVITRHGAPVFYGDGSVAALGGYDREVVGDVVAGFKETGLFSGVERTGTWAEALAAL